MLVCIGDISDKLVLHSLDYMRYGIRTSTRVSQLIPRHWTQRLIQVYYNTNWTLKDWQRLTWTVESCFQLFRGVRFRMWCSCQQDTILVIASWWCRLFHMEKVCSSALTLYTHNCFGTLTFYCFMTICTHSWTLCIPTNIYFNKIRHSVIVPMFHRINLRNFLENSNLVWPLRSSDMYIIVHLWWKSSFALNIQQRRSREVQSRRHGKIPVQSSPNHVWN